MSDENHIPKELSPWPHVTESALEALGILLSQQGLTTDALAARTGFAPRSIPQCMRVLETAGIVVCVEDRWYVPRTRLDEARRLHAEETASRSNAKPSQDEAPEEGA